MLRILCIDIRQRFSSGLEHYRLILINDMVTNKFNFFFKVFTSKFPIKGTSNLLIFGLKIQQAFFYSLKVWKIIWNALALYWSKQFQTDSFLAWYPLSYRKYHTRISVKSQQIIRNINYENAYLETKFFIFTQGKIKKRRRGV